MATIATRKRGLHDDLVDDSDWYEVRFINPYALFMGYLSMAIRGLGFLAITWTTVVLLGGFVSTLDNKDFWCLTMISLLQTAGVYDVFLNEKLGYINQSVMVFWAGPVSRLEGYDDDRRPGQHDRYRRFGCFMLDWCAGVVKTLVFGIVLCPLMALYMFGLLISTGISLWRLIENDFGDGEAHLKPALQVLYSLAVLQGSLFIYRFIFSLREKALVKQVAKRYKFGPGEEKVVSDYARKLRIGCDKDPTYAKERNLIKFAVELIKTESPADYISGVTILDRIECEMFLGIDTEGEYHKLIEQLIGTTSSSTILQKLVQTLHARSPYDQYTRIRTARIVDHFAHQIYLEQFPRGTQCILSLLMKGCDLMKFVMDIPSDSRQILKDRENDNDEAERSSLPFRSNLLAEQGLLILHKLAANEDNYRLISTTQGLVSKIVAPVSLEGLHDSFHDKWSSIAYRSLALLARLMENAPAGEAGESLRREISINNAVISTIQTAFTCECPKCSQNLPQIAVETLKYMPPATKQRFTKNIANMIVDGTKKDSARKKACDYLEDQCIRCTENGELLQQLVEALNDVMPKVLKEIALPYGLEAKTAGDVTQTSTEGFSAQGTDVEKGRVSRADEQHLYDLYTKLSSLPYYFSLCVAIRDTLISAYPHLARQFDDLAADIRAGEVKTFACLVKESQQFVDENKNRRFYFAPRIIPYFMRERQMRKQRAEEGDTASVSAKSRHPTRDQA